MSETISTQETPAKKKSRAVLILPLVLVVALLGLMLVALQSGDPSHLPSVLIGKPVPEFNLAGVPRLQNKSGAPVSGVFLGDAEKRKGQPCQRLGVRGASLALPSTRNSWNSQSRAHPSTGLTTRATRPEAARRFLTRHGNSICCRGRRTRGRDCPLPSTWALRAFLKPSSSTVPGASFCAIGALCPLKSLPKRSSLRWRRQRRRVLCRGRNRELPTSGRG